MTRYTPTYSSNAFAHAQYQAPLKNTESAAMRTLQNFGTSIEDYGRRNQPFDKNIFKEAFAAGRPATATVKTEVVIADDADCANCANHNMIAHKHHSAQLEKQATQTAEQRRLAAIKLEEERERARKAAERDANQRDMHNTLYSIEAQKRAEWEAKKNDRTNLEQTQKLNQEMERLSMQNLHDKLRGKLTYRDELNRKREQAIQLNINGKITDKELERRLKGLQFECYERDPKMKQEKLSTGQFVKTQISHEQQRKQKEKEDLIQPPEVFYTDKELAALKAEAEARNQEVRAHNSTYARDQLNQHLTRQQSEQEQKAKQIDEEREHHRQLRRMGELESNYQRRTRDARNQEMNSTLTTVERQKRAQWEEKKNDKTNLWQSQALQQEISDLTRANIEDQQRQKQMYNSELGSLTADQRVRLEEEKHRSKQEEANARGLRFECYRRDPIMKEKTRETGQFQKFQKDHESQKKQYEREIAVQPPPSLVTTEHLQALHEEALRENTEKRFGLKSLMESQYKETQAQKQARLADERARDAEEAARAAARNAELTKIEREIADSTKRGYNQYLAHQVSNTEKKKALEQAERKYDPHTEKIAQENQMIGERIVKCGGCNSKLSHEKTLLGHSSHHH